MIADISEIIAICPNFVDLETFNISVFQSLRESIEDDLAFSDIVTIYLSSSENLIADIHLAFANQDASKFRLASHSLKSMSSSIGADRLSQICKYFEQIAKSGQITVSPHLLPFLSDEYDKVINAIQTTINGLMAK